MKRILMILVAAMPLMQFAATWYVAANGGSDDNDGKTEETAFATIQKGLNSAKSGDVIKVDDGEYAGFSDSGDYYKSVQSKNGCTKTCITGSMQMGYNKFYDSVTVIGFTVSNVTNVARGGILRNCQLTHCAGTIACTVCNSVLEQNSLVTEEAEFYNCTICNDNDSPFRGSFNNCVFYKCSISSSSAASIRNCLQYDTSGISGPSVDPM